MFGFRALFWTFSLSKLLCRSQWNYGRRKQKMRRSWVSFNKNWCRWQRHWRGTIERTFIHTNWSRTWMFQTPPSMWTTHSTSSWMNAKRPRQVEPMTAPTLYSVHKHHQNGHPPSPLLTSYFLVWFAIIEKNSKLHAPLILSLKSAFTFH